MKKRLLGNICFIFALITVLYSINAISYVYDGYMAFKRQTGAGADFAAEVNFVIIVMSVLAGALTLSLIYSGLMLTYIRGTGRQRKAALVLTALLFIANILYFRLASPTRLMMSISLQDPAERIAQLAKSGRKALNARRDGYTALSLVVAKSFDPQIIKTLIDEGADVNVTIPETGEPVFIAFLSAISTAESRGGESASAANMEAVRAFIESGADVNAVSPEGTAVLASAFGISSDPEIIKLLIDAGADVNYQETDPITGKKGVSALMISAFEENDPETAKILLEKGADIAVKTDKGAITMLIAAANHDKNIELVKTLIEKGAGVNEKSLNGTTPLMAAARNNTGIDIIKILVESGADINAANNENKTALDFLEGNVKMPADIKEKAVKLLKPGKK